MQIILLGKSKGDLKDWKMSGDIFALNKIRKLIEDIQKTPFEGLGKPEALKYNLSGKWSRRITENHRLVYRIQEDRVVVLVLSFWGHYGDK